MSGSFYDLALVNAFKNNSRAFWGQVISRWVDEPRFDQVLISGTTRLVHDVFPIVNQWNMQLSSRFSCHIIIGIMPLSRSSVFFKRTSPVSCIIKYIVAASFNKGETRHQHRFYAAAPAFFDKIIEIFFKSFLETRGTPFPRIAASFVPNIIKRYAGRLSSTSLLNLSLASSVVSPPIPAFSI